MAKRPRVVVTKENETGRNLQFHDNRTGEDMSRAKFVKAIEQGKYDNYHVRKVHGVKTPISNPDDTDNNNLG